VVKIMCVWSYIRYRDTRFGTNGQVNYNLENIRNILVSLICIHILKSVTYMYELPSFALLSVQRLYPCNQVEPYAIRIFITLINESK